MQPPAEPNMAGGANLPLIGPNARFSLETLGRVSLQAHPPRARPSVSGSFSLAYALAQLPRRMRYFYSKAPIRGAQKHTKSPQYLGLARPMRPPPGRCLLGLKFDKCCALAAEPRQKDLPWVLSCDAVAPPVRLRLCMCARAPARACVHGK